MRFSHFFIDRPIFAAVLSIILTLVGIISFRALPVSEFPDIAPPTVQVTALFAGATAEVVSETVCRADRAGDQRRRQHALYVPQATGDGSLKINVVLHARHESRSAQVLVQNRVSIALPRLPEGVQAAWACGHPQKLVGFDAVRAI